MNKLTKTELVLLIVTLPIGLFILMGTSAIVARDFIWSMKHRT